MKRNPIRRRGFARVERLRKKNDFSRVFASSKKLGCPGLKMIYTPNELTWNRVGVTTTKGIRGAVRRNREKRIGREIYRNMKHRLKTGYDMIFIFYPDDFSFQERERQFRLLFRRARLTLE